MGGGSSTLVLNRDPSYSQQQYNLWWWRALWYPVLPTPFYTHAITYTPCDLVEEMRKYFPEPDERQQIGMCGGWGVGREWVTPFIYWFHILKHGLATVHCIYCYTLPYPCFWNGKAVWIRLKNCTFQLGVAMTSTIMIVLEFFHVLGLHPLSTQSFSKAWIQLYHLVIACLWKKKRWNTGYIHVLLDDFGNIHTLWVNSLWSVFLRPLLHMYSCLVGLWRCNPRLW